MANDLKERKPKDTPKVEPNPGERYRARTFDFEPGYSQKERDQMHPDEEASVKRARALLDQENSANPLNYQGDLPSAESSVRSGASANGTLGQTTGRFFQRVRRVVTKYPGRTLLASGAAIGGSLLIPGFTFFLQQFALIQVKEGFTTAHNEVASALEEREEQAMPLRLFSGADKMRTSIGCTIRVKCRYSGISERKLEAFERNANMELTGVREHNLGPVTRYTAESIRFTPPGGGSPIEVNASNYRATLIASHQFRTEMRGLFKPSFSAWAGIKALAIRAKTRMNMNPDRSKATEGDTEEERARNKQQFYYETVAAPGDSTTASVTGVPSTAEPTEGATDSVDLTQDAEHIQEEAEAKRERFAEGEITRSDKVPTSLVDAMTAEPYATGNVNVFSAVSSFLNVADVATVACTAYRLVNSTIFAYQSYVALDQMRHFANIYSLPDSQKLGEANNEETAMVMNDLQRPDENGDSFTQSASYSYTMLGETGDTAIKASTIGSEVMQTLMLAVTTFGNVIGDDIVDETCAVFTNPYVIGALSLVSLIPGGGQIAKASFTGASFAVKGSMMAAVRTAVNGVTDSLRTLATSGVARKQLARDFAQEVKTMALNPLNSIFLAAFIAERYAIPATIEAMSHTTITGIEDGAFLMDNAYVGGEHFNAQIATSTGLSMVSEEEYVAYSEVQEKERRNYQYEKALAAEPFDINDPYSPVGKVIGSITPTAVDLKGSTVGETLQNIAALPNKAIASFGQTAYAAEEQDEQFCIDPFYEASNVVGSPFCVPKFGFTDLNALSNTNPDEVIDYMLNNGHINNDGDPESEEYKKWRDECNNTDRIFSRFAPPEVRVPERCYNEENRTQKATMFRLYTMDEGLNADVTCIMDEGEGDLEQPDCATGETVAATETPGEIDLESLGESSENIQCASGTEDRGVHDGYTGGSLVRVRICEVTDIPSGGSESSGGYGFSGATGGLLVNSRVSAVIQSMAQAAKSDGTTLQATSGFRTMAHQQDLYSSLGAGTAARPGYSNHQLGVAIDINTSGATLPWFDNNARDFGYMQNSTDCPGGWENWHWSPTGC